MCQLWDYNEKDMDEVLLHGAYVLMGENSSACSLDTHNIL